MSRQEDIRATEAFGAAVNAGDYAAFDRLVSPGNVDHDPAPGQAQGPEGYRAFFTELRTAFPDMAVAVETMVADGEGKVAFAYTLTGTHQRPFMGVASTGRRIEARGMQIGRFKDGRMVERWGSSDELGNLKQIGAAPPQE